MADERSAEPAGGAGASEDHEQAWALPLASLCDPAALCAVHSRETLRKAAALVCSEPPPRADTKRVVTENLCARLLQVQQALCLMREAEALASAATGAHALPDSAAVGAPVTGARVAAVPAVTWQAYGDDRCPEFIREAGLAHLESVCAQRNSSSGGGTGAPAASTRSAAEAGAEAAARPCADDFDELRIHIAESAGACVVLAMQQRAGTLVGRRARAHPSTERS